MRTRAALIYVLPLAALLSCLSVHGQTVPSIAVRDELAFANEFVFCVDTKLKQQTLNLSTSHKLDEFYKTLLDLSNPKLLPILQECELIERINTATLRHVDVSVKSAVDATTTAVSNANILNKTALDRIGDILDRQTKIIEALEKRITALEKRP